MSKIEPLLDALLKTGAEEMRLEQGQRIYVIKAGERSNVGREPLQPETLLKLAAENLGPDAVGTLGAAPQTVERFHGNQCYLVGFARLNGSITVMIRGKAPSNSSPPSMAAVPTNAPAVVPAAAPPPLTGVPDRAPSPAADSSPKPSPSPAPNPNPNPVTPQAPKETKRPVHTQPDPKILDLLRFMVNENASDLHLSAGAYPVLRVHGEIRFLTDRGQLSSEEIERLIFSLMEEVDLETFQEKRDADLSYEIPGLSRFRVNVFEDRHGVGSVIRVIPMEILTAEQLNLPQSVLDLCYLTKGLVVVTGPTGSGKSTTLASMVDFINKNRSDHIITIEDPIEFVHENQQCLVNQRQVGRHTRSFKAALRAALREDPDVVLVGEMRDLETISIAIETAETGHLVFGTLHTTTAVSTVDRIIDQFPPDQQAQIRVMLADALKGVIAQVLCKKKEGGRAAALEVLIGTAPVSSLIRDAKTFQLPSIMQTSKRHGMITMNDSLIALVKAGVVDAKEAWMKAVDKNGFMGLMRSAGIPADFAA